MTIISELRDTLSQYNNSLVEEEKIIFSKDKKYKGMKGLDKRYEDFYKQRMFTDEMLSSLYSNIPM